MFARYAAAFPAGMFLGVRGLYNYDWQPPDNLTDDEIATAANEQSRQDYARLQVATGMFRLISTAAWLRYLSTPTSRSQTVFGGASDTRQLVGEAPTTARSPSIRPVGVIEQAATLKRYDARARVRLTAQEPGYVPAFRYKVVLRAIKSLFGNAGWDSRGYDGHVWLATYEPTQGDPQNKRLRTELRPASVLSEIVLFDGPSPTTPVSKSDTVSVRATTFDWYVPVVTAASRYLDPETDVAAVAKGRKARTTAVEGDEGPAYTGGVSIHLRSAAVSAPAPMQVMGGVAPLRKVSLDTWDADVVPSSLEASLENAERRHVRVEEVDVSWQLTWNAEHLDVRLTGKSEQRPFQLYVVVEESATRGRRFPTAPRESPPMRCFASRSTLRSRRRSSIRSCSFPRSSSRRSVTRSGTPRRCGTSSFVGSPSPARSGPVIRFEFLLEANRQLLSRSQSTATLMTTIEQQEEFAIREAPRIWSDVTRASGDVAEGDTDDGVSTAHVEAQPARE